MRAPTSAAAVVTKPTGQSPKPQPRSTFGFRIRPKSHTSRQAESA